MSSDVRDDLPGAAVEQLRIAVTSLDGTSTIGLRGEWDIASRPAISRPVVRALEGCPTCLVLNLSRVSFIDSCGVHVTAELRRRSDAGNFHRVVIPGPRQVQRIFEICRRIDVADPARKPADVR